MEIFRQLLRAEAEGLEQLVHSTAPGLVSRADYWLIGVEPQDARFGGRQPDRCEPMHLPQRRRREDQSG
jgi:hypothetical protein